MILVISGRGPLALLAKQRLFAVPYRTITFSHLFVLNVLNAPVEA
jgi:hypothetical protein